MKICSIEDCDRKHYARGWCNTHYARWRRSGGPLSAREYYTNPEVAFRERTTNAANGCIEWTSSRSGEGYGIMRANGGFVLAHRYAWERANGPIASGLHIDHKCHNRACVNTEHLRAVTNKQNSENKAGLNKNNTSGYRGVSWYEPRQKWVVKVGHNGRTIHGGYFPTAELANEAAIELRNKLHTHNDVDRAA